MKTCDICGRTEAKARLELWKVDGGTYTVCLDAEDCNEVAWNTQQAANQPPPVDQALRQQGYAELPLFGDAS